MSGGEQAAVRDQLIKALSILERLGIVDFNGHFSARLPDGSILINSGASVRCRLVPEDFVVVGADGTCAEGQPRPPAELPLHLAVYQAREDVQAVVHCHPRWSTLLSSTGRDYQVVMPQGALLGEVPVYSSPMSINNDRIAGAIARKLGRGRAALMRSHGSVVTGGDVLEATVLAIYLELNAERQVNASLLGEAYVFSPEETQSLGEGLNKRGLFEKCWQYYLAKFAIESPA